MQYEVKEVFKTAESWMEVLARDLFGQIDDTLRSLLEDGWDLILKEKRAFPRKASGPMMPNPVREVNVYVLRRELPDQSRDEASS